MGLSLRPVGLIFCTLISDRDLSCDIEDEVES